VSIPRSVPMLQLVRNDVKRIVEHQLFDTFWAKATLAEQKTGEIEVEEGVLANGS
jgi:hypothetical protein